MIISNLIECTFLGFDKDGFGIVRIGNNKTGPMSNQTFKVAKKFLPEKIKENDILYFELINEEIKTNRQKNLAESVLKEILEK
ncbi:MAG: hypothetical protein CEN91_315 [Candidatus Berkelbacteria bacterium Licking1014_85]|uniref:Uncharacterized protein n=1 Tax=Candidatus Berkelbacteria bacterium Licking1014_85 TaxID=2017148 RepID=A0A554LK44_9BACT|nr:MAG: hypothetical protein CEN91_315 [Candidatus Berkelbacteria bacterium Licking1014_85]